MATSFWQGKKMPETIRKKMSESHKKNPVKFWEGKNRSEETKEKIKTSLIGNKRALGKRWTVPSRWNSEKDELLFLRKISGMDGWRKAVFSRDNFTCQVCGQYGGTLHAHHIKHFRNFPELRMDIDNGITLCVSCHRKCHKKTNH